jgi:hypothetical protein
MAYFVFLFAFILLIASAGALYASLDLLPLQMGVLYITLAAIAACAFIVTLSIGMLFRRVDRLRRDLRELRDLQSQPIAGVAPPREEAEPEQAEALVIEETAPASEPADEEEPVNENRAGRLPSIETIEHALQTPEAEPTLVGRYSAGGANYMIFSDGSIEADTEQGRFKFASMSDFKRHLADNKAGEFRNRARCGAPAR